MESSHPGPVADTSAIRWSWRRIAALLLAIFLAAAVFEAGNVDVSRRIGKLSTVPAYDDVVYLNSASKFYFQVRAGKGLEAAREFLTSYTHAPLMVLLAVLGFSVFGFHYLKVYYALTLVVFVYLGFVALLGRRLPLFYLACLLLASLAVPFASMAALEFRPDLLWAIFLGGTCVWFLGEREVFASLRPSLCFGLGVGLALLSKPSTFAMTLLVGGGTWVLAAGIALAGRRARPPRLAAGLSLTLLAALAAGGWYLIPQACRIFDYFYRNSFGADQDIWTFKGTLGERLWYYLHGSPEQSNLGLLLFPLLGLYVFGALYDLVRPANREQRLRGAAFLWMLGCLYLVNGLFAVKSPFLGGSFYGFLIFGALWQLARLLRWGWMLDRGRDRALRFRLAGLTGLSMCGVAWAGHQFPLVCMVNPMAAISQRDVNRALVRDLLARVPPRQTSAILLTQLGPVITEYLEMEFRKRKRRIEVKNLAMSRTLDAYLDAAKIARYVTVQDPGIAGAPGWPIPGGNFQPELLSHFRGTAGWREVAHFPAADGRQVHLFERQDRE